jgi:putative addiction module component (TIGR02574 family)
VSALVLVAVSEERYDAPMTKSGREVRERALKLPAADRVRLAHELIESVADADLTDDDDAGQLSPEWKDEIARRLADEPDPENPWPSGEEVSKRLRRALGKRSSRKRRGK